jgi:hypothetical protein
MYSLHFLSLSQHPVRKTGQVRQAPREKGSYVLTKEHTLSKWNRAANQNPPSNHREHRSSLILEDKTLKFYLYSVHSFGEKSIYFSFP